MNIKSILLGSAAALVAVSGARAADAVVMVEPEPVEYVRVCDVYGTGYFYIPGTETCLKIGGYVRMRLEANDEARTVNADGTEDYAFRSRVRARLDFDAREETELGTLRGFIRVEATNAASSGATYGMANAYLQLGGLTVGYLDSLWAETDGLLTDTDWSAGDITINRISYTFATNGFGVALSVEDDGDSDFAPNGVAQVSYSGGWGAAYLTGIYDEDTADYTGVRGFTATDQEDGAFALKGRVELKNLVAADSLLVVEGHYAFDPTEYAAVGIGTGFNTFFPGRVTTALSVPSEFQIGAGYQQSFGKLTAYVSGAYGQTFDYNYNGRFFDSSDYFVGAVDVGYAITSNFSVLGEVNYRTLDVPAGSDFDQVGGFLEIKRTF